MSDQGKANYEGYCAAMPGLSPVPFEELPHIERLRWDAGACSVELWLAEAPVDEDAPGNEPAKVIVVTEVNGRERRYKAGHWEVQDILSVRECEDGNAVAVYAPGAWLSAREDGAEVPDSIVKALRIAEVALNEIVKRSADGGEQPFGRPEIGGIAADALNSIWNETEA